MQGTAIFKLKFGTKVVQVVPNWCYRNGTADGPKHDIAFRVAPKWTGDHPVAPNGTERDLPRCVSKSPWCASSARPAKPGRTSLQTVNLRHPCLQCRWSSLLECFTGLSDLSFHRFTHQLKTLLYSVDIRTSTLAH